MSFLKLGGGDGSVCTRVWACGVATTTWKKGERRGRGWRERENSHQDAQGTSVPPVSGSQNRKSCFRNTATAAFAHSAVPSWSDPSLLLQSEEGVTCGHFILRENARLCCWLVPSKRAQMQVTTPIFNLNPSSCISFSILIPCILAHIKKELSP